MEGNASQNDLFQDAFQRQRFELAGGGIVEHLPGWINKQDSQNIFKTLYREVTWSQPEVFLFGKKQIIPRLQAWYGDPGAVMVYSKRRFEPLEWHPLLKGIKARLEKFTGVEFNSALLNLYRDGQDSVGWHADNEPELGEKPIIASLSLGESRRFRLKPNKLPASPISIDLHDGDLLVMKGNLQQHWQHSLPKTRQLCGSRINLTFRKVIVSETS